MDNNLKELTNENLETECDLEDEDYVIPFGFLYHKIKEYKGDSDQIPLNEPIIQLIALAKDYKVYKLIQKPDPFVKKIYGDFIQSKNKLSKMNYLDEEKTQDLFIFALYCGKYDDVIDKRVLFFALTEHNVVILNKAFLDFRAFV